MSTSLRISVTAETGMRLEGPVVQNNWRQLEYLVIYVYFKTLRFETRQEKACGLHIINAVYDSSYIKKSTK